MVNYVEGAPRVLNAQNQWKAASVRDQLKPGDRLKTQEGDRVELLLNPGSYLRVGGKADLKVLNTDFEDMRFEILEGTAIVESSLFSKKVHGFKLTTPEGDLRMVRDALFRVEVEPAGRVEVSVYNGRLSWLKDIREIATLKSGKRFNLASSTEESLQYAKLDKDGMDSLDRWSRRRAEFLVAANVRLSPWLRNSAIGSYGYGHQGGWVYNLFFNCYTFVPYDSVFSSPYGYAYANAYRTYRGSLGYNPRLGDDWGSSRANAGMGSAISEPRNTSYEQRSAAASAPAAPSARMEAGRSDEASRAGAHSRVSRER